MYTNAQSIASKIGELGAIANTVKPDLILLTESWCNKDTTDAMLNVPGYELKSELRKDRADTAHSIGGGLLVYAKEGLLVLQCDNDSDFNQYCKFKINCQDVQLTFYLIYRPPSCSQENVSALVDILTRVEQNAFLIGDFNLPEANWASYTAAGRATRVVEAAADSLLEQMVPFSTHIKGNTLDLILTNNPDLICDIQEEGRIGKSDHSIIVATIMVEPKTASEVSIIQDWRRADWGQIREELAKIDWEQELMHLEVDQAWENFSATVNSKIKDHTPVKKKEAGEDHHG